MAVTQALQILSISSALLASGSIATLSIFDVPLMKSQPASRSLPMTRWLFSRGSHIFPTAALLTASGFSYLSYTSLPASATSSLSNLLQHVTKGKPSLFLAAAALSFAIGPFTSVMIPTNFTLISKNEELGGARSAASAEYRQNEGKQTRSAEESTDSKDDVSQWKDLSVPQEKTSKQSTKEQDEEANRLLDKFAALNMVRAVLMGAGGVVGLMGALA